MRSDDTPAAAGAVEFDAREVLAGEIDDTTVRQAAGAEAAPTLEAEQ